MRAGDGDRNQVVELLREALDEGRLTLPEYDERVATAYRSVTYADLNTLLADLPQTSRGTVSIPVPKQPPVRLSPPAEPAKPKRMPTAMMVLWTIWGSAVAINIAVWLTVMVTTGHWMYPWPLWVAIPPGVALLGVTIGVESIRNHRRDGK
jgi:hypothetical protein